MIIFKSSVSFLTSPNRPRLDKRAFPGRILIYCHVMNRLALVAFGLLLSTNSTFAQSPSAEARKRMSQRIDTGSSGGVVTPTTGDNQLIVSYVTFLSPERQWVDVRGRKIKGRLVAFSAPAPGKTGPIVVIQNNRVRLRATGSKVNGEVPLDLLSPNDRDYIREIEQGILSMAESRDSTATGE